MRNSVMFLLDSMHGGGAERVVSILANYLSEYGCAVTLILTNSKISDTNISDLSKNIKIIFLNEISAERKSIYPKLLMIVARFVGKLGFCDCSHVLKFYSRNYNKIFNLKKLLKRNMKHNAIAFMYNSIFLTLLARKKFKKVIISDRGAPQSYLRSKTNIAFFRKMFSKADKIVFQSPDVQKWYKENFNLNGTVIYNPIKSDLPEPYAGIRNRKIVNFCRIASEKNLALLITAFGLIKEEYPEYELYIYGNAIGKAGDDYLKDINGIIKEKNLCDSVHILPARNDIHDVIKDCAMFVSSSDSEGMSNSMLEAMAMGMPCVCTDCPAGGARAVITDHVNGILTPVGDAKALYQAMKELIDNPELAKKLGENAVKVREEQSTEKIIKKWMEIIND